MFVGGNSRDAHLLPSNERWEPASISTIHSPSHLYRSRKLPTLPSLHATDLLSTHVYCNPSISQLLNVEHWALSIGIESLSILGPSCGWVFRSNPIIVNDSTSLLPFTPQVNFPYPMVRHCGGQRLLHPHHPPHPCITHATLMSRQRRPRSHCYGSCSLPVDETVLRSTSLRTANPAFILYGSTIHRRNREQSQAQRACAPIGRGSGSLHLPRRLSVLRK